MRYLLFTFLLLLFYTIQVSSQTNFNDRKVKWDFNISSGFNFGGPSHTLDKFLNNSGYNWDLRTKNYIPILFDINRTISSKLRLGINIYAFKQDLVWETMGWSNSKFKTIIINPYLSFNYKDFVFLNAGPAINNVSFFHSTGTSLEDDETYLKAGFILKNILKVPKKTRVYLQFEALYSFGGTISPYYHIENSTHQYTFTTLHAENLPINYFYIGTGLGFRFFTKTD